MGAHRGCTIEIPGSSNHIRVGCRLVRFALASGFKPQKSLAACLSSSLVRYKSSIGGGDFRLVGHWWWIV